MGKLDNFQDLIEALIEPFIDTTSQAKHASERVAARAALMEEWNKLDDDFAALSDPPREYISPDVTKEFGAHAFAEFKLTDEERRLLRKAEDLFSKILDESPTRRLVDNADLLPTLAKMRYLVRRDMDEKRVERGL